MLYSGPIDPRPVFRRSAVAGVVTILVVFLFAGLENLISAFAASRFELTGAIPGWIAAGSIALALGPLHRFVERTLGRWLGGARPEEAPAAPPRIGVEE